MLNSERIESRFGSYGVRILHQAGERRETCLYSQAADGPICRTIAIVRLSSEARAELGPTLERVRAGASLGASLAEDGWRVRKVNQHIGDYRLQKVGNNVLASLMKLRGPQTLAMHVYRLDASRDGIHSPVAALLEVHHPDYLDSTGVASIYGSLPWQPLEPEALGVWHRRLAALASSAALFN